MTVLKYHEINFTIEVVQNLWNRNNVDSVALTNFSTRVQR